MGRLKITSWNVEHLRKLLDETQDSHRERRRQAVIQEIRALDPDILCLLEGPKGEAGIDYVTNKMLDGDWVAVKATEGDYAIKGSQWIWFLIRKNLADQASLLPPRTWDTFAGKTWTVHLSEVDKRTGRRIRKELRHRHYRHPQVLVLDWNGFRVEFIGLHLKSKFVGQGRAMWEAGGEKQEKFIDEAIKARAKMTTEATNVRAYIDAKFNQVENPAIFVLGDLNDGPGKEHFETHYMLFDLISNIQGDVFFASRFLNHCLFDFPDHLRWSVEFADFVQPERDPHILLDHILFTQGLTGGALPWRINNHAGLVEHEIHDVINATLPKKAQTSDHKPVSVVVTVDEGIP